MSKNRKNPPTEVVVCCWSPNTNNWWAKTCVVSKVHRKIKTQAEAYALQRRLLKKAKRMLDAKRPLDAAKLIQALLVIEPGAWVREYDMPTAESRLVTFKPKPGQTHIEMRNPHHPSRPLWQKDGVCSYQTSLFRKNISIHPKEFCK